jgi:hypothetical protein
MRNRICNYCRQNNKSSNESDICTKCEEQLKAIIDKVVKKYDGAMLRELNRMKQELANN